MSKLPAFLSIIVLFGAFLIFGDLRAEVSDPYHPWLEEKYLSDSPPLTKQAPIVRAPSVKKAQKEPERSSLEKAYEQRIGEPLNQYGYDILQSKRKNGDLNTPMGAMQDNFVIGAGDEIQVAFTGQRADQGVYKIDMHGTLIITDFPPVSAAGKTISQLRDNINAQLASMHNTQAYVSLASIRQIGVLIIGHVQYPGRQNLNAFHSVVDALTQAGGIDKDGSLRRIKLVRGGHSKVIDLYDLMMNGAPHVDLSLRDGDRIIIPPIGPTIAIAGGVKQPGIYEIRQHSGSAKSEKLNLDTVLKFAGGILTSGEHRFMRHAFTPDGQEVVSQVRNPLEPLFDNGTILSVLVSEGKRHGTVRMSGQTRTPGLHDLSQNKMLSSLLQNAALGDEVYPLIGIIERWNEDQLAMHFIGFPIRPVLKHSFDTSLKDNDVVRLLSYDDISTAYVESNKKTLSSENVDETSNNSEENEELSEALKSFLKERSVYVRGAVRKPGLYPVAEGITLDNVIAAAGGLTLEANSERVEITYSDQDRHQKRTTINLNRDVANTINISAGDAIRVNQKSSNTEDKSVLVAGEVINPGRYDLLPGDKVSNLIERAGGLTEQAYPAGTVFSRKSERKREEMQFRAAAHDMERRLASAIERKEDPPNDAQIAMVQDLAQELSTIEAVGRITVEADPSILVMHPEFDMLLEESDRLYIPKRPLTVRVSGEVLSPASLQFRKDKGPRDYIYEAGGFTYHADKDRAFVVYPDGSAQPLRVNNWNHTPVMIPPGSTIVVPQDPKPFSFIESAKEVGQILSNLAITAVFIDDIRD